MHVAVVGKAGFINGIRSDPMTFTHSSKIVDT